MPSLYPVVDTKLSGLKEMFNYNYNLVKMISQNSIESKRKIRKKIINQ